jgi:hypothetical protein
LQLYAFDTVTASKIFDKIFTAMMTHKPITVYTSSAEYQPVITYAGSLKLVKNYRNADIVLVDKSIEVPKEYKGIIFTTNPSVFEQNENAVGAFYWEHGRPKIYFLQSRLKSKGITLSKQFQRYVLKELP